MADRADTPDPGSATPGPTTPDPGVPASTGRVWSDPAFKGRLLADPKPALAEIGITVPADVSVRLVTSKGAPGDVDDHSLMQFVLECRDEFTHFFLPSPRSPCAQQAAYGRIVAREPGDPVLDRHVRADAEAALRRLERRCAEAAE